jgi:hypothetical protein
MESLLANTYEQMVLSKKTAISRNGSFNSPVPFERDSKLQKLEYDVFSRILDITGMINEPPTKKTKVDIITPSLEDCIKELIAIEKSNLG